jgi:hypothetical protein
MYPTISTINPIVKTNVKTKKAKRKLDRNDPKTYLSITFIPVLSLRHGLLRGALRHKRAAAALTRLSKGSCSSCPA